MSPIDPHRHLLDEPQATQIFETRIVPQELSLGTRQERPTVIFVGGQPGAGKTMSTEGQVRSLQSRGQPVVVNSDFYKPFHPQYARLLREDDRHAAAYTSADGRRWMAMAERWLISHGIDVVIETTMRDPGDFIEPARMFRDHGYRVEATILAVPAVLSQLGILARYSQQIKITGHGRLTLPANHDASYIGVLRAAEVIDAEHLVDVVAVRRRGNEILYVNSLDPDGEWTSAPATATAIKSERERQWSLAEKTAFWNDVRHLLMELPPAWHGTLNGIIETAATNLAARSASAPKTVNASTGPPPPPPPVNRGPGSPRR